MPFVLPIISHDIVKIKVCCIKNKCVVEHILIVFSQYGFTITKPSDNVADMITDAEGKKDYTLLKASTSKAQVWISTICILYELGLRFRFIQVSRDLTIVGQDREHANSAF